MLKEGDLITQKYTIISSDFDNGYDNWAPDNNTENITYSDNPGKDSQKSQIFVADYKYDLGENIVGLNLGMSQNETLHGYDSDWGNYDFWVNWDGDDHPMTMEMSMAMTMMMITEMKIMMMIMMKILIFNHMISLTHLREILIQELLM